MSGPENQNHPLRYLGYQRDKRKEGQLKKVTWKQSDSLLEKGAKKKKQVRHKERKCTNTIVKAEKSEIK